MSILVTGGAGYIGSHTVIELLNANREVVIVDDFSNSKPEVLEAIRKITGKEFKFYELNYLDKEKLDKVFKENNIEAVMNFAGFKAVGESVQKPIEYYTNNISGTLTLLDVMRENNVKNLCLALLQLYMANQNLFLLQRNAKQEEQLIHMVRVNYL